MSKLLRFIMLHGLSICTDHIRCSSNLITNTAFPHYRRTLCSYYTANTKTCGLPHRIAHSYQSPMPGEVCMHRIRDVKSSRDRRDNFERFQDRLAPLFCMGPDRAVSVQRLLNLGWHSGVSQRQWRILGRSWSSISQPLPPFRLERRFGLATYPSCGVDWRLFEPLLTLLLLLALLRL